MRKFRNGRILGLILTAAMFITSVPVDVLAVEDLVLSEDVTLEDVNIEETAEPVVAAPENATQTAEDMILGEPEGDVTVALDDVVEDNTSADVTLADDVISDDAVSDGIIQDGAVLEEDADTLSADEVTRDMDGTPEERLKGYLREGASNIEEVEGTLKEGKSAGFGTYVKSKIYTYEADGETWRALYLWSDESNDAKLDGVYIYSVYYYEVKNITDIILDDSITGIETNEIFREMEKVSHVRLSANLKTLAQNCFQNCSSIESITIPKTMEVSGYQPFTRCSGLKTITFEDGIKVIPDYIAEERYSGGTECRLEKVYIPSSVKEIGKFAFHGQSHLREVIFTDISNTTLSRIGMEAFSATNLEYLDLPKFGGKWKDEYGKEHWPIIQNLAFDGIHNPKFTKVIIPEGVVTITEIWGSGGSVYKDLYLPSTLERKNDSTDDGFLESTAEQFFPESIERIHYPGSSSQFEKKALGSHLPGDMKIIRNCNWYKKMVWNSKASQVSGISVPSDKTTILKYYDNISDGEKETIDLTVSPKGHLDAKYEVNSSDDTIVKAELGIEDTSTGKLPLTLTYYKKKTEDNPVIITVTGGQASTTIKVIIKDKDQVKPLKFKINGNFATLSESEVKKGDWIVAESDTRDCVIKYKVGSGGAKEYPNGGLTVGSEDLFKNAEAGEEITVTAQAFKQDLKPSDAVTIKLINKLDMGDVLPADLAGLDPRIIPEGLWIPEWCYSETPEYNGSAIALSELKVFWYNKLLRKGKDYTVKYANNIDATSKSGKNATVTVTCKGSYSGTLTKEFVINNLTLTDSLKSRYSFTPVTLAYKEGLEQTADIGFVFDGRKLALGKDYSVKYRKNGDYTELDKVTSPGKYDVLISGEGNYDSGFNIDGIVYVVDSAEYVNMNTVTVSKIKDQQLVKRGTPVEPVFTVTYNKQAIPSDGSAYIVEYKNNASAGTASVTLTGTGTEVTVGGKTLKFMGTKTFTYKIKPINMSSATVTLSENELTYTGAAVTPHPVVKLGDDTMTIGYDYTLSYKSNTKAGNAYVIVNGKGSFKGKKKVKFKINKAELTGANVTLDTNRKYTVGGAKPAVTVKLGEIVLSKKDYKVSYGKNSTVGGNATVTVTGKGSCTGSTTSQFILEKGDLSNCRTSFADKMVSNKPKKYAQKLTIKDKNGKKLKAGRDYNRTVKYTYTEDTWVEQKTGKKSSIPVLRSAGEPVGNSDIIPAGTTINVEITGAGNYEGTLNGSFRFGTKKVSSLKFSIPNQKFTGSRILPGKDMISVKNMTIDDASKCYEIVSYGTNIKTGKGSVTVRGKGAYIGTKTIKFKITK